jgi:AcrR family transcriptional regulator
MGTARAPNRWGEGARLRADIVSAAAALLEESGNEDAVTLRGVARRVGVTAPAIYRHFADRAAILDAVVGEAFEELAATVAAAAHREDDASARVHAVCAAYLAFATERPYRYRVLFGRHRTAEAAMPGAKPMDELRGAGAFGVLVDAVGACADARNPPGREVQLDATALWVALHGYATLRASVPAFPWPDGDALVSILVTRLAGVPSTGPCGRDGTARSG